MTEASAGRGNRLGRAMEIVFPIAATAVFVVLWIYVALAAFTDSPLPADTWAWLSGLDTVVAVMVWVLILPLAAFLWAWQADLEPIWMGLVMLGLVAWTGLAVSGLRRGLFRRRPSAV
jgi:hypothetical protein